MRILPATLSPAQRAAILGVSALALAAGAWQYDRSAIAAFARTAESQPWLQSARSELSLLDRVRMPWLDRAGILRLAGPKAIGKLDSDPFTIDGLAGANHSIDTFNQIAGGCGVLEPYKRIEECSRGAATRRFRRIEANFTRSILDPDHYVAFAGNMLKLANKIRFSTQLCNHYPATAEMILAVRYDPSDRLPEETVRRTVAPGECVVPFDRKLRQAPSLHGTGRAGAPARFASTGGRDLVWNDAIAISDERSRRTWALVDSRLCHTSAQAICGGVRIGDPRAYAKALAASLANDARFALLGPDPLFKFTVGATFGGSSGGGDIGAWVHSVAPGGPAELANLQVGDQIVSIGGTLVFSNADISLAVDAHGSRFGREASLPIEVVRDGELLQGTLALAFYKPYWDARGFNNFWAGVRGFFNAFSLGVDRYFVCGVRSAFRMTSPEGLSETEEDCLRRWALEGEAIAELYRTGHIIGSVIGNLTNPLPALLPRSLRVGALFGSVRAGRIVEGTVLAVVQQSVSTVASARPGTRPDEIFSEIQTSLPRTVAMGVAQSFLPETVLE